jgi:hypothetical protein
VESDRKQITGPEKVGNAYPFDALRRCGNRLLGTLCFAQSTTGLMALAERTCPATLAVAIAKIGNGVNLRNTDIVLV